MGFDGGQILLDSDNGAYYAGQTIFGRVVFDQTKPKTIHGIYVSCKGFCKVHWTTTETRTENDRTVEDTIDHESYEEYFKRKIFIVGSESGEHQLNTGHHEFNFNCPIPNNCPSSFEGTHGHIRYSVKVVMVTTGMFSMNKEKRVAIRVHAPVDLNLNPYCKEPLECEMITSYCCWCISAGSSEIRVKLPKGGYCPGQVIPVEINVVNHSSVDIDELNISIKKEIKYEATSRPDTRTENEIIAMEKRGPIAGGTTPSWTIELPVPIMDIYNFDGCRFIHINYIFRVATEVSGCHQGDEETHAIIFGNIPLLGFQDTVVNPFQNQLPQTGPAGQPPTNFTPAPIISQPLPNPGYNNTNVPQNTAYPGAPSYPGNQQYPNVSPYPAPNPNAPYPGAQYPPNQGGYQGNQPNAYPPQPSPYPGTNPNQPYPGANPGQPYPGGNPGQGYPGANPAQPYPGSDPAPPYPGVNTNVANANLVQSGNMGFTVPGHDPSTTPLLSPGANAPYPPNPYNAPSAPSL